MTVTVSTPRSATATAGRRLVLPALLLLSCGPPGRASLPAAPADGPIAASTTDPGADQTPTDASLAPSETPGRTPGTAPRSDPPPPATWPSDDVEMSPKDRCVAKLKALGLEHGAQACDSPAPVPRLDGVQQLPKACAAPSPTDRPCSTYGGVYRLRLSPDPTQPAACLGTKPIQATIRLKGSRTYRGSNKHTWELGHLIRALGIAAPDPSLGAAVRDGVCCIDVDMDGHIDGQPTRLVLKMARGERIVTAKASVGCDDSGDRVPLLTEVTLLRASQ